MNNILSMPVILESTRTGSPQNLDMVSSGGSSWLGENRDLLTAVRATIVVVPCRNGHLGDAVPMSLDNDGQRGSNQK